MYTGMAFRSNLEGESEAVLEIRAIDIERWDQRAYCGTLEYRARSDFRPGIHAGTLLWTVEWRDTPEVLVEFFPGAEFEDAQLVRRHQQRLIDSLLDTLAQRIGHETLFT